MKKEIDGQAIMRDFTQEDIKLHFVAKNLYAKKCYYDLRK